MNEIAQQHQRQAEMYENWRRTRQEEGLLTGYRLKTKVFRSNSMGIMVHETMGLNDNKNVLGPKTGILAADKLKDDNDLECNAESLKDGEFRMEQLNTTTTEADSSLFSNQDIENVSDDEDVYTCSICLLNFDDGDRVADLKCSHHYHADCISEWIKKKVSR